MWGWSWRAPLGKLLDEEIVNHKCNQLVKPASLASSPLEDLPARGVLRYSRARSRKAPCGLPFVRPETLPENNEGRVKKSFTGLRFVILALALGGAAAVAQGAGPLRQAEAIALPNVSGRIDHFSADVHGRRLFISALGNHTVEVVDLA